MIEECDLRLVLMVVAPLIAVAWEQHRWTVAVEGRWESVEMVGVAF